MFKRFKSVENRSASKIIDISNDLGREYCQAVGEPYDAAEKTPFLGFAYALVSALLKSRKAVEPTRLGTPLIAQLSRQYGKRLGEVLPHEKLVVSMAQADAKFAPQVSGFIQSMEGVNNDKAGEIAGNMARDLYIGAFQKIYPNLAMRQVELKDVFTKCYANASEFAKAA